MPLFGGSKGPKDDPYYNARGNLIRDTYEEYADPQTGELRDPDGFQNKVVEKLWKYGDMEGVRKFTQMQKENAYYDRATQSTDLSNRREARQQAAAAQDFVGGLADMFHSRVEQIKDPKARQEYVNKYYPQIYDMTKKAGYGEFMSPEYDHEQAGIVARAWAKKGRGGKEETGGKDKTPSPDQIERWKMHNRAVDAAEQNHKSFLEAEPGATMADFRMMYPEDAKLINMGRYEMTGKLPSPNGGGRPGPGGGAGKKIKRTGKTKDGRKVIQYEDGSIAYQ